MTFVAMFLLVCLFSLDCTVALRLSSHFICVTSLLSGAYTNTKLKSKLFFFALNIKPILQERNVNMGYWN